MSGQSTDGSSRLLVGLTIGILVLAGCGSFSGGNTVSPAGGETVTPAPVPTDPPTPTPVTLLAPGVTPAGVVDPLALAEAHESILSTTSETVRTWREVRYRNGELRSLRVQESRVSADRRHFYTAITVDGSFPPFFGDRIEFYSDGETIIQATVLANRSRYFRIPYDRYAEQNNVDVVVSSPDAGTVFLLFSAMETRVVRRSGGQELARYRLRSSRLVRPAMLAEAEDVANLRNATLTATIDERGVLREYTLRYDATIDGRNVTVTTAGLHTAIGTTNVTPPAWVGRALNRTG